MKVDPFLRSISNQSTLTVGQLQSTLLHNKHLRKQSSPALGNPPPLAPNKDLNIVSPFYPRCTHHPKGTCKCMYHKRQPHLVKKKMIKCRTQES